MRLFTQTTVFLLLAMVIAFFIGCATLELGEMGTDQRVKILVGSISREIGCEVANTKDVELQKTVVNIWESVRAGELTADTIAQLSKYVDTRPTLVYLVQDLVELAGVSFDEQGNPIGGLDQLTPEILDYIESRYAQGFDACEAWAEAN